MILSIYFSITLLVNLIPPFMKYGKVNLVNTLQLNKVNRIFGGAAEIAL
jgi:hypothetical protein